MCNPVSTAYPDLLLAKGLEAGLEWEVTSNRMGYRCGYVRIPAGHPWHGLDYDDVEPCPVVHGGLTFAQPDTDCGYLALMAELGGVIRTTEYVSGQCQALARQAADVIPGEGFALYPRPLTARELAGGGT